MNGCKYSRYDFPNNIEHAFCTNEELKTLNKSNGKDIPCIEMSGLRCGKFERADDEPQGDGEK